MPKGPSAAAAAAATAEAATLSAVPMLDNPLSRGISLGRVAALLGLLAWRFDDLVAEPAAALQAALPAVAAAQAAYLVLCVPGGGAQQGRCRKPRPGEKKKPETASPSAIVTAVLALVLSAMAVPAIHVLLVLFGAPFLDLVPNTLLLAAHFSLLGVFPVLYARGLDAQALMAVAGCAAPLDETVGALLGAGLGAWLGAVPIPLDWDRDWQRWPVTIVCGMYAGSCVGSLVGGTVLYGATFGESAGSGGSSKDE
ncbi:Glycosylphosphatidylinositol anchor biosynthesis protein 11 [Escovopsis weberi]|uniref:Glycosylphosphatidylinositol anchor biosynthesis protein 11 n=1 Tax=Escovopsis weberi TaxID=150374 RepID=A0A0M9VX42_ESCWE|nr:Glycosylphosphatidylinositol anchor biosynthesis protein 11 [Escovopsis weberi]